MDGTGQFSRWNFEKSLFRITGNTNR